MFLKIINKEEKYRCEVSGSMAAILENFKISVNNRFVSKEVRYLL